MSEMPNRWGRKRNASAAPEALPTFDGEAIAPQPEPVARNADTGKAGARLRQGGHSGCCRARVA